MGGKNSIINKPLGSLAGGSNSLISKPLGTGKGSVNKVAEDALGPTGKRIADFATGAAIGGGIGGNPMSGMAALGGISALGGIKGTKDTLLGSKQEVENIMPAGKAGEYLKAGEAKGEQLVGATVGEVGQQRADIRKKYQDIVNGESIAEKNLTRQSNADKRTARATAAVSGGSQMSAGQEQAMNRQSASDIATARSAEYLNALNKLEAQYRGAAGDIASLSGKYGAIGVGVAPAPTITKSSGIFDGLFG